jgi:hypothetical protein
VLIDYNWDDEYQDFKENPTDDPRDHIFNLLHALDYWVRNEPFPESVGRMTSYDKGG